jgi:hypothetical protein
VLDSDAAQRLIPGLCVPLDFAVYMPLALNINPKNYLQVLHSSILCLLVACQSCSAHFSRMCLGLLTSWYIPLSGFLQALFLACQNLSDEASVSPSEQKQFKLCNQHIDDLQQLASKFPHNLQKGKLHYIVEPSCNLVLSFTFRFSIHAKLK